MEKVTPMEDQSNVLTFPRGRVNATMARGARSFNSQYNHVIWHFRQRRITKEKGIYLLDGLNYYEVDDVHDCMHSKGSIALACIQELEEYQAIRRLKISKKKRKLNDLFYKQSDG